MNEKNYKERTLFNFSTAIQHFKKPNIFFFHTIFPKLFYI